MVENILALPKSLFVSKLDTILNNENNVVISILDSDAERVVEDSARCLTFWFDDVSPTITFNFSDLYENVQSMKIADAKRMVDFILKFVEADEKFNFIVHCSAGICRSGAVAKFIQKISSFNNKKFDKANPNILPNEWVFNCLMQTYLEGR